jgi:hypothetical protein
MGLNNSMGFSGGSQTGVEDYYSNSDYTYVSTTTTSSTPVPASGYVSFVGPSGITNGTFNDLLTTFGDPITTFGDTPGPLLTSTGSYGTLEWINNPSYLTLETLEEGVYDIKGGKIIIKKIMVSEEQLAAMDKTYIPEDTEVIPYREMEELLMNEDREI